MYTSLRDKRNTRTNPHAQRFPGSQNKKGINDMTLSTLILQWQEIPVAKMLQHDHDRNRPKTPSANQNNVSERETAIHMRDANKTHNRRLNSGFGCS